jgi:hypothetical protein
MELTNIIEQVISGIIATLVSTFIIFIIGKFGGKKIILKNPNEKFKLASLSLFSVLLFLTSFFGILSLAGFYFEWAKFEYLIIITIVFGVLGSFAYQRQCPNCKSVFGNRRTNTETIKKEQRPYNYRDLTIYYYSDGTEKNREHTGKEKTKIETIETRKDYFECSCGHKWWGAPYEVNLSLESRPKPNKIKTNYRNPEGIY